MMGDDTGRLAVSGLYTDFSQIKKGKPMNNHKSLSSALILSVFVVLFALSLYYAFTPEHDSEVFSELGKSGIVFYTTEKLLDMKTFYINEIGCRLWLDQGDCLIFQFGNMLLGFHSSESADLEGLITFFYERREDVDRMYNHMKAVAVAPPKENTRYGIYHFFARDPEGRTIEFQHFMHPIDWDFKDYQ